VTTNPLKALSLSQPGPPGPGEIVIPLVLLKHLLYANGGSVSIDEFDLASPLGGYVVAERTESPVVYRFRWVEE
jgi:hypothetical protein